MTASRLFAAAAVAALLLPGGPAAAQGFDCARARLDAELAVCANRALGALDEDLNTAFTRLSADQRTAAAAAQTLWRTRRDACGSDEACLARAYAERLADLQALLF